MIKKILYIVLISFLTACSSKNVKVSETKTTETKDWLPAPCEERSNPLDIVNKSDTFKILIEASDCGEWGGHKESIYLQRNKEDKIVARFIKDSVTCDNIIKKGGIGFLNDQKRVIVIDTNKLLNLDDEKLISKFIQRLIELYLKNEGHANSGSVFQVINTNKTLNFTYWNSGDCRDTYYGNVRQQIFGSILKRNKMK